jgi:predicted ArsR family transcriptional regulator
MGRSKSEPRLDEISTFVQTHPDNRAGAIAEALGLDNKTLMRTLVQLEDRGDLLQEDDRGLLKWFGRRKG